MFHFKRIAPQCQIQLTNGVIVELDDYYIDSTNDPDNITSSYQILIFGMLKEEFEGLVIFTSTEIDKLFWRELAELPEADSLNFLDYHLKIYLLKGGSNYKYIKWFCESYSVFKTEISLCDNIDSLIYEWTSDNLGDWNFYLDNFTRF